MVTQQIRLYMDDTELPDIRMVSGDVGREIVLYVYPNKESTESLDLTTFELRVIYIKPDKTFVVQDYIDGIMDIPTQVGAVVGNGYYQIRLAKAGEEIYSAQGNLIIDDYILNNSMVESIAQVNGYKFPDDFLTIEDFNPDLYATKQYVDDAISAIPNPLDNYSTDEQIVGTWIDGKTPIYEKTYYFSSLSASTDWTAFDSSITISKLLYSDSIMTTQSGQQGGIFFRIAYNTPHNSNSLCYYYEGYYQNLKDVYITVRYTKPPIV